MKRKESVMMKETSEKRLTELELRNSELESKIKKLNTPSGVEEEIRSKFSVAKAEENMVIIVREEGVSSSTQKENDTIWSKIKGLWRKK
jgi:cell division protein FtsB